MSAKAQPLFQKVFRGSGRIVSRVSSTVPAGLSLVLQYPSFKLFGVRII